MNRRTLIRRIGAATTATVTAAGAVTGHHGECHTPSEDPDCFYIHKKCSEIICPWYCCDCLCAE